MNHYCHLTLPVMIISLRVFLHFSIGDLLDTVVENQIGEVENSSEARVKILEGKNVHLQKPLKLQLRKEEVSR